ncbi:MAG: 2-phospho-L-lactate transferase [Gammaproteobacteria bacterium]|nr:2-phospho-L-lactate transferase [Gammaproteobacteria bacterium]
MRVGENSPNEPGAGRVVALCGGIGGAKLALGLYRVLDAGALHVICNTGDDFEHLGLHVSPDIDTVTYTLAGVENPDTGWGRRDETWTFMRAMEALGGDTWFALGDGDLAIHVERTRRLRAGDSLSRITGDFARRFSITADLVPMSDDPVRTVVETTEGDLPFQEYFVRMACRPVVTGIHYEGAGSATPSPGADQALSADGLRAVVICPSNPFLSIDPILAVPGIREALTRCRAPVVTVSPLIGGRAVKGPTAKIMDELSIPATTSAIADHYRGLLDGIVIDDADASDAKTLSLPGLVTRTLMMSLNERDNLAKRVLDFADQLRKVPAGNSPGSPKRMRGV